MFTPETYPVAVITALVSTICWGSWSVCLVHSAGKIRFEGFYIDYSIGIAAFSTLLAFTLGMIPGEDEAARTFFDDFDGSIPAAAFLEAFAAGLIFNIANIGLTKSITLIGLTVAFPLCIGTALVVGTLVNYAIFPEKNEAGLLIFGVLLAFAGICCVSVVQMLKDMELAAAAEASYKQETSPDQDANVAVEGGKPSAAAAPASGNVNGNAEALENSEETATGAPAASASNGQEAATGEDAAAVRPEDVSVGSTTSKTPTASLTRKLTLAVLSGLLMGLWSPVASVAMSSGMTPYCEVLFFSYAVLVSSFVLLRFVLLCPLEGGPSQPVKPLVDDYRNASCKAHILGLLGGVIWDIGTAANAIAGSAAVLNFATSYGIGQAAPMVGVLWGLIYFCEFAGTSFKVKGLLALTLVLFVFAIILIAMSAKQ
eukprot:TRINITY_DN13478_c0_g1_i1.p1 TRINITY_DN13478_c0_g1~~TRINITY_DN13478_c0_g1_i1.p1  ORF type:complete len:428 (-),score=89.25 TRINITY_DN13478_c0_g1_i1:807-2090(-)